MSWQLASFLILGAALALGFAWYERSRPPARVLALVAALAALAVVGRIAFAPLPNVKPTTDIVLFAGYALGAAPGLAVGAITALVSNVFFSHGPWTPWQMAAWGGVGMAGGMLGWAVRRAPRMRGGPDDSAASESEGRELGRWPLALACGLAGLAFGLFMDLQLWTLGAEQTLASYLVISARSLPFNIAHVGGNVVFCLLIGPPLVRALRRYRRRLDVRWPESAVAGPACVAVAAGALAVSLVLPVPALAASSSERAADYLVSVQNPDGGFGAAPGKASVPSYTAWAALGLAASGRNPRDVSRGGNSIVDYLKRNAGSIDQTNEIERTILVLRASDLSPRDFAGRDLRAELLRRRARDGSFDGLNNLTAFGIFAMRASGESAGSGRIQRAADWLEENPNADGGFGSSPGGPSFIDDTAAVLEALAVAGRRRGDTARAAIRYLEGAQRDGGGFPLRPGSPTNSQSTAWAVRGLTAAGYGSRSTARQGLAYIRSLQIRNGSIRFSSSSTKDPNWVTGDAAVAAAGESFPLPPTPLRPRPAPSPSPPSKPESEAEPASREAADREGAGGGAAGGTRRGDGRPPARALPPPPPPPPLAGNELASAGGSTPAGAGSRRVRGRRAADRSPSSAPTTLPLGAGAAPLKPLDALAEKRAAGKGNAGSGLAMTLVALVVLGLMVAIALSARGRRFWAVARGMRN